MAAYVVSSVAELKDSDLMSKYAETATPTVAAHGGKFLASGDIEKLDGEWNAFSGVVIEFPNKEAAKTWYNSPEYQAALSMRLNATQSSLLLFPGD